MIDGKPSVVLLNPPSSCLHLRDLHCSVTSKANYYWPPIDLLVLSGFLSAAFRLRVIDAVAERLSLEKTVARIAQEAPVAVVSMVGSAGWREDSSFLAELKRVMPCTIAVTGDVALDEPAKMFDSAAWIDAIIHDFTVGGLADYLSGRRGYIEGLSHREDGRLQDGRVRSLGGCFSYPVPRHELFPLGKYRLPQARRYPFSSILTNYACPFTCSYCVQGSSVSGHKHRDLANTVQELEYLKWLGVRELYFRDPLFEAQADSAKSLCSVLKKDFSFSWSCNCRVNTINEELISAMKDAGCACIAFGLETSDEELLRRYRKPVTNEQARNAIKLCQKYGIRSAGYFIIGLPGETVGSARDTIKFAVTSGLDYAAFSAVSPDYGTALRDDCLRNGVIPEDLRPFDRSRAITSLCDSMDRRELRGLLREAVFRFYMRPSYLFHALRLTGGFKRFLEAVRTAFFLLKRYATD